MELSSFENLDLATATYSQRLLGAMGSLLAEAAFMILFSTHSTLFQDFDNYRDLPIPTNKADPLASWSRSNVPRTDLRCPECGRDRYTTKEGLEYHLKFFRNNGFCKRLPDIVPPPIVGCDICGLEWSGKVSSVT